MHPVYRWESLQEPHHAEPRERRARAQERHHALSPVRPDGALDPRRDHARVQDQDQGRESHTQDQARAQGRNPVHNMPGAVQVPVQARDRDRDRVEERNRTKRMMPRLRPRQTCILLSSRAGVVEQMIFA